jgi:hypothetical protein
MGYNILEHVQTSSDCIVGAASAIRIPVLLRTNLRSKLEKLTGFFSTFWTPAGIPAGTLVAAIVNDFWFVGVLTKDEFSEG